MVARRLDRVELPLHARPDLAPPCIERSEASAESEVVLVGTGHEALGHLEDAVRGLGRDVHRQGRGRGEA